MKYRGIILGSSIVTAIGTSLYWMLYFTGVTLVVEYVPGYTTWFQSFILPDFWILLTSILLAVAVKTERKTMMITCGLLTASGMIFLALNELQFSINTGMIFMPLTDIGLDLVFKIYCLSFGAFYIKQFSGEISRQLN